MANVFFFIRTSAPNAPIYLNFSADRNTKFKRKTRETVNPEYWSGKVGVKGTPKNIKSAPLNILTQHTELKTRLNGLQNFIISEYNNRKDNDVINGEWLDEVIEAFYNNGKRIIELDYIDTYLQHYKTQILPFRKYRGKPVTIRTRQKQETIILKFQEFLKTQKKRLKVSDYNITLGNRFVSFLRGQNLNDNTVGKYLKYTKTIFKDAKLEGVEVHPQLSEIKGFTTETPTHYLTVEELDQIQQLKLIGDDRLEVAREWLIIGSYTGQRASDLFRMNAKQIVNLNGKDYINLSQQKTKTPVMIPIHDEVQKILDKRSGQFPPVFSENSDSCITFFNRYLETIARLAGIDRLEYGRKWNPDKKCYQFGKYPFYDLISSHVCRRTFATMYYGKIPTAIIMAVTGHKTERKFLTYIGVDNSTLSEQMYTYWEQMDNKKETVSQQTKLNANN